MKNIRPQLPDSRLVTVGTVPDAIDAELVKNKLVEQGIECRLDGESQGGLTGLFTIGIMVCEQDAAAAREILGTCFPHLFGSGQ